MWQLETHSPKDWATSLSISPATETVGPTGSLEFSLERLKTSDLILNMRTFLFVAQI
jgi:hypothetical protein